MIKYFLAIAITIFAAENLIAQEIRKTDKLSIDGFIIFEESASFPGTFDFHFIKSSINKLSQIFLNRPDTINAFMLYEESGITNYKNFLDGHIKFDSLNLVISQTNHLDKVYEDTCKLFYRYGCINYNKSETYSLARRYKKIFIDGYFLIVGIDSFIPVKSFAAK